VVKIRAVLDPSVMDYQPAVSKPKELSPRAKARLEQERLFRNRVVNRLTDETKVFRVKLGANEKQVTIRKRIQKVADDARKDIAIKPLQDGFYVGLMTPARRPRRGRPRATRA
jgi:hypothetical protein